MATLAIVATTTAGQIQAESRDQLWRQLKSAAESYLGRPYVWGAVGLKSFDCSGYVWRIFVDNGILMKRTTARKLYMILPKVSESEKRNPGNIVFFNSLKHCGMVSDSGSFYHAEARKGTSLARFNAYWSGRVCGYWGLPGG